MVHLDLRLAADGLDFWVDVHLHRFGRRWLAVADLAGDTELGGAHQPTAAIAMALTDLGVEAQGRFVAAAAQQLRARFRPG